MSGQQAAKGAGQQLPQQEEGGEQEQEQMQMQNQKQEGEEDVAGAATGQLANSSGDESGGSGRGDVGFDADMTPPGSPSLSVGSCNSPAW